MGTSVNLAGQTSIKVLVDALNLHLLASIESAGHSVPFRGKNVRVREVDAFDGLVVFEHNAQHLEELEAVMQLVARLARARQQGDADRGLSH